MTVAERTGTPRDRAARLAGLQRRLAEREIAAALITLSRDVFYYAGTAQPCTLLVTKDEHLLLVRRALDFVRRETWIDSARIVEGGGLREISSRLGEWGVRSGRLGLEMDVLPANVFRRMEEAFAGFELVDVSAEVLAQRMVKDRDEIAAIRSACAVMNAGHRRILEALSEGMTELELAAEVEHAHRTAGHEGVLSMRSCDFYISRGPLASGENLFRVSGFSNTITGIGLSPAVPAGPSSRRIRRGDLVVVDIPTCRHGYHCDETRTYVLGRPSAGVRDLFAALREISDAAIARLEAGVTCGDVFHATQQCARHLGVEGYFLGLPPRKGNFVGHGIGLDANEPPILFQGSPFPLPANSVVTVEVHLVHPGLGAVKLEDMVLVRDGDCEVLSVTERELFAV